MLGCKENDSKDGNFSGKTIPPRLVGRLATTIVMEDGLYIGWDMKKIIFIIIALLAAGSLLIINKGNLQDKGNLMDNTNTYTVIAPNGDKIEFDKKTNLIASKNAKNNTARLEEKSQMLLQARSILDSSPYKNYKPLYYNPKPNSLGQTDYLSFKPWLDISYKSSSTKLSPWTKSEKAYYESLKIREIDISI